MKIIINWCNYNEGFLSMFFSVMTIIISLVVLHRTNKLNKSIAENQWKQQKELFNEEFRPLLIVEVKEKISNGYALNIKNIGSRGAKNISLYFFTQIDKNRCMDGEKNKFILLNECCLPPNASYEYTWENDNLADIAIHANVKIKYYSLTNTEYIEIMPLI